MKSKMYRKIGAYALLLCLLITLLPVSVLANPNNTVGNTSGNTQTYPEDAIKISTPNDLIKLAENCRTNTWSVGKTVVLLKDIDMKGEKFKGIPTFGGTFLGQGYKITNVNMSYDSSIVGFFRYLQKTAVVDNLTIEGKYNFDNGHKIVGAFVGKNSGRIKNCTFKGTVGAAEKVGGFVGVNETNGVIENCNVSGTVYGNHFVGGFAGVNHGVIRSCKSKAKVNVDSAHNKVGLGEITLDGVKQTEKANAATDIGGISGKNSGVIRSCVNEGNVGYQHMGYNVGGIAGTQNGYIVDCKNYGYIQGSKEVAGIVGQLEPNIVLKYDMDSIQILSGQIVLLGNSVDQVQGNIQSSNNAISNQVNSMKEGVTDVQSSIDAWKYNLLMQDSVDQDQIDAAKNDIGSNMQNVIDQGQGLASAISSGTTSTLGGLTQMMNQFNKTTQVIGNAGENINLNIIDISGKDTDADTLGKVSNCYNYANVKGDKNVGGIVGILAEENDLNKYQDVDVYGSTTLNVSYQIRAVVRDCMNSGLVEVKKNSVGGIAGKSDLGAVLECINIGNLNAIGAKYVGGIVGDSSTIIRNCSVKSVMAGDEYVGGIAGRGNEVLDCYAFVDIKSYIESAGAILGSALDLPDGSTDIVLRNYYFNAGKEVGGIDGITYTGATNQVDVDSFLKLPYLSDLFRTITVTFKAEGMDDVVYTLDVGDNLELNRIPKVNVDKGFEHEWELLPVISTEVLSMGETAAKEYLTEKTVSNILFDQTYQMTLDIKDNVIGSDERSDKNLSFILAKGLFSKYTTMELKDTYATGEIKKVNYRRVSESWNIEFSNPGIKQIHYLVPDKFNADYLALYIQNDAGKWERRDYEIEGAYIIFDFHDGETGFALRKTLNLFWVYFILLVALIAFNVRMILDYVKTRKLKKSTELEESMNLIENRNK